METMNSGTCYLKRHSELRQQLTNKDGSLASRLTQALADMLVMGRPSLTVILQNTQCLCFLNNSKNNIIVAKINCPHNFFFAGDGVILCLLLSCKTHNVFVSLNNSKTKTAVTKINCPHNKAFWPKPNSNFFCLFLELLTLI